MSNDSQASETPVFRALVSEALDHAFGGQPYTVVTSDGHEPLAAQTFPGATSVVTADPLADLALVPGVVGSPIYVPPWGLRESERKATAQTQPNIPAEHQTWATLVPAGALARLSSRRRSEGHFLHGQPALVVEGPLAVMDIHASFRAALVVCTREPAATTRFFSAPSDRSVPTAEILGDFKRLLKMGGGRSKLGFVLRGTDLSEGSLRFEDHDPAIAKRIDDLAGFGSTVSVGDVFQVLRPRPSRDDDASNLEGVRVLSGRDVVAGQLEPGDSIDEPPAQSRFGAVPLQADDLVLPRFERKGRPTPARRIKPEHLPVAAGHAVIVLRVRETLTAAEATFYEHYLGSARLREMIRGSEMAGSSRLDVIARAPLPVPDGHLIDALRQLDAAEAEFNRWAGDTRALLQRAFDAESAAAARADLIDAGRTHRQRVEAAQAIGSLDHRVATFYPYPIAHKWRVVRSLSQAPGQQRDAYDAVLDCFETLMAFGAAVALAHARLASVDVPTLGSLRQKFSRNGTGPTIGEWVNILKEVSGAKAFRAVPESVPLGSIRSFLIEESETARAQQRLKGRRDDESHQRKIDTQDLDGELEAAIRDLQTLLDAAAFMADMSLLQVRANQWDSLDASGVATVESLRGDQPVSAIEQIEHEREGLETDSLYVQDVGGELVLMRPYLVRAACPQCGTRSIFHPDRRVAGRLQLKAIDHGHSTPGTHLEAALARVGYLEA